MSKDRILNILIWLLLMAPAFGQNASPIIQPHMTFVDASGSPCSNCRLYSYAAGTTTPLATFTDAAAVSVNTNPIVLGADGGPLNPGGSSGAIWYGTNSYKLVLKDPLGSIIWTVDQVRGGSGGSGGTGNPNGFGTFQTSTKDAKNFLTGGVINTDASNSLNNGPFQTLDNLCGTACSMTTPPTSSDTSVGGPLPVLGGKVSSMWEDKRFNSQANWNTNPIPQANALNSFPLIAPSQTAFPQLVAYTKPFPAGYGFSQGSAQNGLVRGVICTGGYSLGNLGELFPTPLPGYPNAAPWAGCADEIHIFNKHSAGIGQGTTWLSNCYGIADCQTMSWNHIYMGGVISVSDEGDHALGEMHASTAGDTTGTITSVMDTGSTTGLMKIKINATVEPNKQGQDRYIFGSPVFSNVNADQIIAQSGDTPAKVVLNDITLPVSTAWGFMTSYCDSGTQDIGVGVGKNGSTVGCDVTVQHGTFDQSAPVCGSYHTGGLMDIGMVVIAPPTALSGGHQTIQMTMHKPLGAGAVLYQGGGCGMGINWRGDISLSENTDRTTVSGSVVPCIGSTDAHTLLCPTYLAFPTYTTILSNASHAGTRATSGPHAFGFTATLTRTDNVVSALLNSPGPLPFNIWNGQLFATVAHCDADPSFNVVRMGVLTRMPGPATNLVQWNQTGADSAGCTGALLYPIGTETDIVNIAELYSVADPAVDGTVHPDQVVNGYLATSVNPYFATVSNPVSIPTHYAASGDILNLQPQFAQPFPFHTGLNISLSANSADSDFTANGSAIEVNIATLHEAGGNGGVVPPADLIYATSSNTSPFRWLLNSDFSPSWIGGAIRIGACSGFFQTANDSFCDYPMFSMSGSDLQEGTTQVINHQRKDTIGFRFLHSQRDNISFNPNLSKFDVPTAFLNSQYETNMGGVLGGNFVPTTGLGQCTTLEPNGTSPGPLPCYRRVTSSVGSAAPTGPGAPVTNRVIYVLIGNDDYGLFASPEYVVDFSPSPITPTFSNTIKCKDLPAGKTAQIYLVQPGIDMLPVTGGNCTAPTDTVVDIGTYDAAVPPVPWIAGTVFYSGAVQLNALLFNDANLFGTGTPAVTSSITQTAPGVLAINGSPICTVASGCGGGGGGGTVTSVSSGNMSPLFNDSVANSTTTPTITHTAIAQAANTVFGNFTGGSANPTFSAAPVFSAANLTSFPTFNQNTTGNAATATALSTAGTTTTVLHGNAAGAPSYGAVNLANDVTGNLGVTHLNSGTSASSTTFWRGDGTWATPSGSGNTTSTSLTTNALPKASGANSIINSSLSDNGTTVSTTEPFTSAVSIGVGSTPPTACGSATGCEAFTEAGTAGTPTAAMDYFRSDTTHQFKMSLNGGAEFISLMNFSSVALGSQVTGTLPAANLYIASGSTALHTAAIASGACDATTATATGAATTNRMTWNANADLSAVTGYVPSTSGGLAIQAFITSNTANFKVCNWSASSITPGAVTIVWGVQP